MTSIYFVSYSIDGVRNEQFVEIRDDIIHQQRGSTHINEGLMYLFKLPIHDKLHNLSNCEMEGRCFLCSGHKDLDTFLWNKIIIRNINKIT
jgi:hypothetical protein